MRFVVMVPPLGVVPVPIDVATEACRPPADDRTLYAGLFELTAVAGKTPRPS